jgi:hypothetical protein
VSDLEVGDRISQQFGPYLAYGTVVEVQDHGAVIAYDYNAMLVGFPDTLAAPNGTPLTTDRAHGFIGRAHWAATKRMPR